MRHFKILVLHWRISVDFFGLFHSSSRVKHSAFQALAMIRQGFKESEVLLHRVVPRGLIIEVKLTLFFWTLLHGVKPLTLFVNVGLSLFYNISKQIRSGTKNIIRIWPTFLGKWTLVIVNICSQVVVRCSIERGGGDSPAVGLSTGKILGCLASFLVDLHYDNN